MTGGPGRGCTEGSRAVGPVTRVTVYLSLLALSVPFLGCSRPSTPETVWIGHVAPLSGVGQPRGGQAKHAMQLAADEANQQPGRRVAVRHADSRGEEDQLRPLAERLVSVNKVAALLVDVEAADGSGLGALAQQHRVPLLVPCDWSRQGVQDFVFETGVATAEQGRELARLAARRLKASPVLVLRREAAAAAARGDAFMRAFRKEGGTILGEPATYRRASDYRELVRRIGEPRAGAVFLAGSGEDLVELARALGDGPGPVLWAGEDAEPRGLPASVVVYRVSAYGGSAGGARAREFARRFEEQFEETPDVGAVVAYEGAQLLFHAARGVDVVDGPHLQKELEEVKDFDGLCGPVSFGPDHALRRPLFVLRSSAGKSEVMR